MLDKAYDPKQIEQDWYERWEKAGYFAPNGTEPAYCIMIPPPNVTGSLHMGHAFQQTLMDILIRYHRMQGIKTLWQVGTDHAGIATQMVVERQLLNEAMDRHQLGREAFVKRIWQWKQESGGNITRQLRRMGASVDWTKERFTLDEGLSNAVQTVFIQLYREGLIYRGKRLVNWDPALKTAVSDLEVESEEESGFLWTIRYPLAEEEGFISVATTRPETLLGDVAVAVHPDDERYAKLIGQKLKLPLTDRLIPIIADKEVDPAFGTGAVKITPAHDFNDYLIGERHHLPKINIFTVDAHLNENVPKDYQGLDRFVARKKIIHDLTALDLIEKHEKYTIRIPRGDRSGVILEPMLMDQWFVKMTDLAKPAIEAVETGAIKFIPENWSKTYFGWLNNIQDWCISRQLWWGHRIPAWYDENGKIYVGTSIEDVRKEYQLAENHTLKQDEDVLDTWFSSALWPFSTLGWPENTESLETFYPTQVLITGFDIIFFWVARMVMFGLKFTGKIPFHEVYINGLILDQEGNKMSKTKGNVIDPLDIVDGIDLESLIKKRTSGLMQPQLAKIIEKQTRTQYKDGIKDYGTDALRFSFASLATPSRYIRFDLTRVESYRHFCNKLWNAARYVLMNVNDSDKSMQGEREKTLADRYIESIWQKVKENIQQHLQQYRFDLAANAIYEFTWNEFCDWYLELSKPALNSTDPKIVSGTRYTLVFVLEEMLRVIHPFMPYISEEIWQNIKGLLEKKGETLMLESYPKANELLIDDMAESEMHWIKSFILGIRNIRGEMNISPAKLLPVLLLQGDDADRRRITEYDLFLKALAKLEYIRWLEPTETKPLAATALVGHLEILIPMRDLIDTDKEKERLRKEIEKMNKELEKLNLRLEDPKYVQNAPAAIVQADELKRSEFLMAMSKLKNRQEELNKI